MATTNNNIDYFLRNVMENKTITLEREKLGKLERFYSKAARITSPQVNGSLTNILCNGNLLVSAIIGLSQENSLLSLLLDRKSVV